MFGEYVLYVALPALSRKRKQAFFSLASLVSREGLEPSTPGLKGPCSNQLSYRPKLLMLVGDRGVEPLTSSTSKTRSSQLS